MTTRRLAILTLALVLGTMTAVGWYLEGERTVQAAPGPDGPHMEHLWRCYPSAATSRRARRSRGVATSQPAAATTPTRPAATSVPWVVPASAVGPDPMVCGTPDSALRQ